MPAMSSTHGCLQSLLLMDVAMSSLTLRIQAHQFHFSNILIIYSFYYVCKRFCLHTLGGQKQVWDPLELELRVV